MVLIFPDSRNVVIFSIIFPKCFSEEKYVITVQIRYLHQVWNVRKYQRRRRGKCAILRLPAKSAQSSPRERAVRCWSKSWSGSRPGRPVGELSGDVSEVTSSPVSGTQSHSEVSRGYGGCWRVLHAGRVTGGQPPVRGQLGDGQLPQEEAERGGVSAEERER